jgi:hypothetical protein
MARKRKYKVGDRIFFERTDGTVDTAIVLKITEESYIDDKSKDVPYQWLTTWENKSGKVSYGIEDYSCLSSSNPKCKVLAAKYEKFDKEKDKTINSILEIMSPWESKIQSEIIDTIKLKLHL